MRTARIGFGVLLFLLGSVWTGQGLGYIRGSFMTGSTTWLIIGLLVDAIALALVVGPGLMGRASGRR